MIVIYISGSMKKEIRILNRKADFLYTFQYSIEAGIVLESSEIKSIRNSAPSLCETYCFIDNGEIYIKNLLCIHSSNPLRNKKLLLHKKQIKRIIGEQSKKSTIIIPKELYELKGKLKILIAIGVRDKKYDQRKKIMEKESKKIMKYDF